MIKSIVAAMLLLGVAVVPVWGQSKTGTTIGTFLEIEPSARIAGLGNAGVALDDGIDAVYYNAAAIGRIDRYGVEFSHSAWLADISYDYVAGVLPLGRWGTGFATVTALNSGDLDVRTVDAPLGTGEKFSVNDLALGIGYGLAVTDRFTAGVQFNYLQETIWHTTMSAGTVSIGTIFRTSENGVRLGASLTNFGTQGNFSGRDLRITYDANTNVNGDNGNLPGDVFTDSYSVPVRFRVGLAKPLRVGYRQRLTLAVSATHPNDNSESLSGGAEYEVRDMLAVRFGYQDAFIGKDSEVGLAAGGGLKGKLDVYSYRVDYAWADHGRLGSTHRFSVGLAF